MKRFLMICLFIVASFAVSLAQSARGPRTSYYLSLDRPGCCILSPDQWLKIQRSLVTKGIPAFFGDYKINDYSSWWYPSTVQKTVQDEGGLIVGPFASSGLAEAALQKLVVYLPNLDGEYHKGLQQGPTIDPYQWQIGMYQIWGFSSSTPITVKPPKVKKAGTVEGVVIDIEMGNKWMSIIVRGSDGRKYSAQISSPTTFTKTSGNIDKLGNRVRIIYKDKEDAPPNGVTYLEATSIIQIKK